MNTLVKALLSLVCCLSPEYFYSATAVQLPRMFIAWIAGYTALLVGKNISLKSSLFPLIQIAALQCILQWLASRYLDLEPMPLLTVALILIGFKCGDELRKYQEVKTALNLAHLTDKIKSQSLSLTQLSLVKQEEADRRILAGDLHDQVLNDLKIVRGKLNGLKLGEEKIAGIDEIDKLLDSSSNQIRQVMESLFPSVLENLGLSSALEDLLKQYGTRGNFRSRQEISGSLVECRLEPIDELLIFRIVQEALNNVVKHSGASQVILKIEVSADHQLTLSVSDNGKGIEASQVESSRGLRYVRQRADLLGAQVTWQSVPAGKGTVFTFVLPPKTEVITK